MVHLGVAAIVAMLVDESCDCVEGEDAGSEDVQCDHMAEEVIYTYMLCAIAAVPHRALVKRAEILREYTILAKNYYWASCSAFDIRSGSRIVFDHHVPVSSYDRADSASNVHVVRFE